MYANIPSNLIFAESIKHIQCQLLSHIIRLTQFIFHIYVLFFERKPLVREARNMFTKVFIAFKILLRFPRSNHVLIGKITHYDSWCSYKLWSTIEIAVQWTIIHFALLFGQLCNEKITFSSEKSIFPRFGQFILYMKREEKNLHELDELENLESCTWNILQGCS